MCIAAIIMEENCHDNELESGGTGTSGTEVEPCHSDVQVLLDSLQIQKEKLQEKSLLTCAEFSMLCKHLDTAINTKAVSALPENLRLSFDTAICDFISVALTGKMFYCICILSIVNCLLYLNY